MKNSLWSVYLALLNTQYGISAMRYRYRKDRKRLWEPLLLVLVLVPFAIAMLGMFWRLTEMLFVAGLGFGQPHLALVYGAVSASLLTLFFGFFSVLSAFYFSTDLESLVPLPLKSREILLVKLAVVLTGKYILNAFILFPIWLRYGLLAKVGAGYALSAPFVFLLLPLIPLLVASLVVVLLMRVVNLSRHRDKLTLISGLLIIVFSIGLQVWMRGAGGGDLDGLLEQILAQTDGLVRIVGRVFPSATWSAQAMAYAHQGRGWLNLLFLVLAGLVGLGALLFIGERVFLRSVLQGFEASKGGRRKTAARKKIQDRPVLAALSLVEARLFLRDPNYALNGLVGYVLFPFLAGFSFFTLDLPGNPLEVLSALEFPPFFLTAGIALYFLAMTSMSMIPSTTFSREGRYLWFMRSLPVGIEQVVLARGLAAAGINSIGCLVGVLPIAYLAKWPWWSVLVGVLFGLMLSVLWSLQLIMWDLRRPMLDWENPVRAVKSNLNAIVGSVFTVFLVVALGMFTYRLAEGLYPWLAVPVLVVAAIAIGAADFYTLEKYGRKMWRQIEGGM